MQRLCARALAPTLLLSILLAGAGVALADDAAPLTLAEAQHLALERQPLIAAQAAVVSAAHEEADAEGSLPDPMLMAGVIDLPTQGTDRFSASRDDFTMYVVGIEQEFPSGAKRELRQNKALLMAVHEGHALDIAQRTVTREATLAWLERWQAERELAVANVAASAAESASKAADVAYRTGHAPQSDLLGSGVALELMRDEAAQLGIRIDKARPMLARWIGAAAAERPMPEALPDLQPPPLEAVLAALGEHPEVAGAGLEHDLAANEVALAKADYRPDWSAGLEYGYRPDFADYVSLNIKLGLPLFTRHRQDPRAAAAADRMASAEQSAADTRRRFEAEVRAEYAEWQGLRARLAHFDDGVVPQAQGSAAAAERAYGAGSGSLSALLNARQAALAAQRARIQVATDLARSATRLAWYHSGSHP